MLLIMVVWESVPDEGVRVGHGRPWRRSSAVVTQLARYSMLTWWQMPRPGGQDAEFLERALAPAQEDVAFLVALEFAREVAVEGGRAAVLVDLDGVIDDQVHRDLRFDRGRVALRSAAGRCAGRPGPPRRAPR